MGNRKNTNMLPIDGKKLKRQIRQKTDLNLTELSIAVNQCGNYLTKCMSLGRISAGVTNLLQMKFGIFYEDYKADPVQEPAEVTKVPEVTSWDGLSEVIRSAIKDNREELEDMMTSAFRKALEG